MNESEILSNHFAVGNVIFSDYRHCYDLVVAFVPSTSECGWSVTVRECDTFGNPISTKMPRTHYTYPDRRNRIVRNILVAL
jgi:hypothetical protein